MGDNFGPPISYRCLNDCRQEGCPGHLVRFGYSRCSDVEFFEIDGKCEYFFDENMLAAALESRQKMHESYRAADPMGNRRGIPEGRGRATAIQDGEKVMGQQIIKQPDGLYALFSSSVDDFVVLNATPQEIIDDWVEQERERLTKRVGEIVAELERGGKPYHQFTMTWDEAKAHIAMMHPVSACKCGSGKPRKEYGLCDRNRSDLHLEDEYGPCECWQAKVRRCPDCGDEEEIRG